MCGIFAYIGKREAVPILLEGLRTLEYRGYDSAGLYVSPDLLVKSIGKVSSLAKRLEGVTSGGTSGIAHTRWATHGEPSEKNAHPHTDATGDIHLIHNGIIENWQEIKRYLLEKNLNFYSETDSEILAKLIGFYYEDDLFVALDKALKMVKGTYGLALMSVKNPDQIIVARMGSPLVIGLGKEEYYVASDPSALLSKTKEVVYLADGEIAILTSAGYEVRNLEGKKQNKVSETIDWDVSTVQKNGYEHFMEKEIFEAESVIENTIRGRILDDGSNVKLGGLESLLPQITNLKRLVIVGCGSAYLAGSVGRLMLEEYARLPVELELGSEYRYKTKFTDKDSAVLVVSQSGETMDVLASVKSAKEAGILTLGMVNVVGSSIARLCDAGVYNHAGPEIAVASTKAFMSQLTVFVMLTVLFGRAKGTLGLSEAREILQSLQQLPVVIRTVLKSADKIKKIAEKYSSYNNMMYIGRGLMMPLAYEGALKLKEVSYIHAEAYAGGELKHGSIALLEPDFPVLALVDSSEVREKMLANVEEVKARKSPVILFSTTEEDVSHITDDLFMVPKVHPLLQPLVFTLPLQLFAYYVGLKKGLDVDQPRNLAKSVTVE